MSSFVGVAPVLPVRDVGEALHRYAMLGFEVTPYEDGSGYGYAQREAVSLHVSASPDHDPLATDVSVYFYVDDADALHAEWAAAGVEGRHHPPVDAGYGLREGAYVDPDGNLHRYGSRLDR